MVGAKKYPHILSGTFLIYKCCRGEKIY